MKRHPPKREYLPGPPSRWTRGRGWRSGPASRCGAVKGAVRVSIFAAAGLLAGCGTDEPALARGDRLWADSEYTAALAEYRLALRQNEDEETLARVAHAYIVTGAFERAREHYDRLLAQSQDYTDQAIFDYVTAARRARDRANRYGMAVAVEAALALRPGLPVDEMAAPLARYYASTGDADRALNFFEYALSHAPTDSAIVLLYEIGELHVGRGNCVEAVGFFNAYRQRAPDGEQAAQARWHVGNCAFQMGRQARQRNELDEAVRQLDIILDLGVPQNLLDQAWFERGEALLALDRRGEALQSFLQVLEVNRTRSGQLVERAQQRIDQIRFGRTFVP